MKTIPKIGCACEKPDHNYTEYRSSELGIDHTNGRRFNSANSAREYGFIILWNMSIIPNQEDGTKELFRKKTGHRSLRKMQWNIWKAWTGMYMEDLFLTAQVHLGREN